MVYHMDNSGIMFMILLFNRGLILLGPLVVYVILTFSVSHIDFHSHMARGRNILATKIRSSFTPGKAVKAKPQTMGNGRT